MTIREQIRAILDEELMAEEQTFCGQPACPTITGKDEVVDRLVKLFLIPDVSGRSEQLKCQCKKAKFTRTVDANFNPLCGRCGRAL